MSKRITFIPAAIAVAVATALVATSAGAQVAPQTQVIDSTGTVAACPEPASLAVSAPPCALSSDTDASATGFDSVAVGINGTSASGTTAVALGAGALAAGALSTSVGPVASAAGDYSTALGNNAQASGEQSAALGAGAYALGEAATAVGGSAGAMGNDSVALGALSVAMRPDSVSLGDSSAVTGGAPFDRQLTNLAPGTEATDAVNLQQMQAGDAATLVSANATAQQDANTAQAGAEAYADADTSALGESVARGLGGASSYSNATHKVTAALQVAGQTYSNVNAAIDGGDAATLRSANQQAQQDANTAQAASEAYTRDTAVQYVPGSDPIVALRPGTVVEDVAAGTVATDAANVGQVVQAEQGAENWAQSYTNYATRQALTTAEQYTDAVGAGLNRRIDYSLSAAMADSQAAAALAGQSRDEPNRVAVGLGDTSGVGAVNVTYQHLLPGSHWAWNVGVSRSVNGNIGTTIGGGVSFGW